MNSEDSPIVPEAIPKENFLKSFEYSRRRILFFGLMGGISNVRTASVTIDEYAKINKISASMVDALNNLHKDPRNTVVILTSASTIVTEKLLENINTWQICENGYYYRLSNKDTKWHV